MGNANRPVSSAASSNRVLRRATRSIFEPLESRQLLSGGALDTTFGSGGLALADVPGPGNDSAGAALVLGSGKLLVAGGNERGVILARYNTDGTLDSTFGDGGQVTDGRRRAVLNALAVQQDGKIVVAGGVYAANGFLDLAVARYNADGSIDTGFAAGGFAVMSFGADHDQAWGLAIQGDDKIIAGGEARFSFGQSAFAIVRLNSDGSPDSTFGPTSNGKATATVSGNEDLGRGVALDAGGGILQVGTSDYLGDGAIAVVRYTAGGAVDASYGAGGAAVINPTAGLDAGVGLVILPGGNVIVSGTSNITLNTGEVALARLHSDGALDTNTDADPGSAFGPSGTGVATDAITPTHRLDIEAVAVDSAGNIVVAGERQDVLSRNRDLAVLRYDSAGSRDGAFGSAGTAFIDAGSDFADFAHAITTRADGEVIIAGSGAAATQDVAVAQLTAAGAADTTWGGTGLVLGDFVGSRNDTAVGAARQSTGKIVVAGYSSDGSAGQVASLSRHNPDGSIDTTFGNDGTVTLAVPGLAFTGGVAIDSTDRIVISGYVQAEDFSNIDVFVARFNADGTPDTTFGSGGLTLTDTGTYELGGGLAIAPGGEIYVAGSIVGLSQDLAVFKYDAGGTLDATFGTGGYSSVDVNGNDDGGLAVTLDGTRVVVAGFAGAADFTTDFVAARFNSDGSLDGSFASGGLASVDFGGDSEVAYAITTDGAGNLVLAGSGPAESSLALARLDSSGALDASFGSGGKVLTSIAGAATSRATALAIQPDGRIVAAGLSGDGTNSDFVVARYEADGSADLAFGTGGTGYATFDFTDPQALAPSLERAAGVLLNPDGSIVIAGTRDADMALIRLNDGVANVDPTADAGGPYAVYEGGAAVLAGSATAGPGATIVSYEWDLDYDGVTFNVDATGPTPTFSAAGLDGPSLRTIALRVTDSFSAQVIAAATVAIANAAPTLTLAGTGTSSEASAYTISFSASDAGPDTVSGWTINWGDGHTSTFTGAAGSLGNVYADDASYTITATATDEDGTYSTSASVAVTNVAPALLVTGSGTVAEGSSYTLALSATDPGADTISQWSIDWGDGVIDTLAGTATSASHTYADGDASYSIGIAATDEDGTFSTSSPVTVTNVAPTLTLTGSGTSTEGASYSIAFSAADVGADTVASWSINWGDGHTDSFTGPAGSLGHVYIDDGNFTITATATDEDGSYATTSSVVVANVAPTVAIVGGTAGLEGSLVSLLASVADDGVLDTQTLAWHVVASNGQVIADGAGTTFAFTPVDNGSYTVSLTATDNGGSSSTALSVISVANVAPTASAGSNQTANEGSTIALAGSASDPGVLDTLTYSWHVVASNGQSISDAGGSTLNFTAVDNGTYTATLTVTDKDGASSSSSAVVTILNVAPTASAGADQSIVEGASASLSASASDAGALDTVTYAWSVVASNGQIIPAGSASTFAFTAIDNGTYTVTLIVTDNDGASTADTAIVNAANVAPTANAGADQTQAEGSTVALVASASDPGLLDTLAYSWHVVASSGQSIADGATSSFNFVPNDNGTYTVTLTVTDKDGAASSDSTIITVTNVAPTASIAGPATGSVGQPLVFAGVATDPGSADTRTFAWTVRNAANAVVATGSGTSFTYTPAAGGTFTVALAVTDDDGGVGNASTALSVAGFSVAMVGSDLVISATPAADDIDIKPGRHGVGIEVFYNGSSQGTFLVPGKAVVFGGAGNDTITIRQSLNLSVDAFGGDGDDVITAGSGGDFISGDAGDDSLKGRDGADVILGGEGDDLLSGGDGNDVLIGGHGADRIIGNANDDILIAGTTSYDSNRTALDAIRSEWSSSRSYLVRVANIRDGSGSATRLNGGFFLTPDVTVFDDAARDVISGDQGSDWFFFNADTGIKDKVTDLANWEVASDLDFIA